MRRITRVLLFASIVFTPGACSDNTRNSESTAETKTTTSALVGVTVTSSVFTGSAPALPVKYTCDGANTSFPLEWKPASAVTVDTWTMRINDPDAPGGGFVHWVVENIPASTTGSEEGGAPAGGTVKTPYRGPCPPKGSAPHHYVILVQGLSGANVVAKGTLTATYQRQ